MNENGYHLMQQAPSTQDLHHDTFVSSHRCLADLQAEGGHPDMGAVTQAHMALLALVQAHPQSAAWHRAAA
jgi:hypothetical protein